MPLNKNVKALLETLITENEYLSYSVRRCITKCLNDDTKEANADFITQMKTKLIMQELDMLPNNVILIAATNRLDVIDDAVLNRFSIKQKTERLSLNDNREFARFYLKAIQAENYINDIDITECINEQNLSQRQVVTKIIQLLGDKLYQSLEEKQNAIK